MSYNAHIFINFYRFRYLNGLLCHIIIKYPMKMNGMPQDTYKSRRWFLCCCYFLIWNFPFYLSCYAWSLHLTVVFLQFKFLTIFLLISFLSLHIFLTFTKKKFNRKYRWGFYDGLVKFWVFFSSCIFFDSIKKFPPNRNVSNMKQIFVNSQWIENKGNV